MDCENQTLRRTIFNGADKDAVADVILHIGGSSLEEERAINKDCSTLSLPTLGVLIDFIRFDKGWIGLTLDDEQRELSPNEAAGLTQWCLKYGIELDLLNHLNKAELLVYCHLYETAKELGIKGLESPKDKAKYLAGNVVEEYLTFRGKQIEISGDKVLYEDTEYKFDDFLVEMFPGARCGDTVVFMPEAAAKLLKLGPTARTKIKYDILERRCGLPDITEEDEKELAALLRRYHREGDTIHGYYRRSRWPHGIKKIIAFGADLYVSGNIKGAIEKFFVYKLDELEDRVVVRGADTSWAAWLLGVKAAVLQAAEKAATWQKISPEWKKRLVEDGKIALYYQNGRYAAIPDREIGRAVKAAIDQCFAEVESAAAWGADELDVGRIVDGCFGELQIPDIMCAAEEFEVNYDKDVIVTKKDASRGVGKAVSQVYELASERLRGFKRGDVVRTKELKERGYDNSDGRGIRRLVEKGILKKSASQGKYELLVDFSEGENEEITM